MAVCVCLLCFEIPLFAIAVLFMVLSTIPGWLTALLFMIAILCMAIGWGLSSNHSGEVYYELLFTFGVSLMIGTFLLAGHNLVRSEVEDESKAEIVTLEEENAKLEEEIGAIVKEALGLTDEAYEDYYESFDNDLIKMADGTLSIQSNVFVLDKIKDYEENLEKIEELREEE